MDLKETINRCQLGEKEAFQELVETIEKDALATAYLISGTKGIAEDILQETYIKCFREIKNLHHPEAFKVWFFKILVRTGWEMSKKQSNLIPMDISSENEVLYFNINQCTEDIFDNYEIKHIVHSAVNNLNSKLKTVVILYYFNDMSIEEISKVLGCVKSTVKSRLFYARAILKKQLGTNFSPESHFKEMDVKECNENG